jgi:two-component system, cell cycle sensor histidine kinase and response regulator CckA
MKGISMMDNERADWILDCIGNPVFIKDEQYRYVFVSDSYCQGIDKTREQIIGRTDYDLFPKAQADVFRTRDETVFHTGSKTRVEDQFIDSNGNLTTFITIRGVYSDKKDARYMVGAIRDISEKKRAELALLDSEANYRTIIEQSITGVFIYQDNRLRFVNNRCCEILGYTSEELTGNMSALEMVHTDNRKSVEDILQKMLSGAAKDARLKMKAVRKDGETVIVDVFAAPANFQGSPAIIGTFYDITEQEKMQDQLRRSEERFRKAFITSPDSININRLSDGMYVTVNKGFTELTGYTFEEVIGKTALELNIWADPADRARLVEGLKTQGKVENLEAQFRLKNGEVRYGMMSASLIDLDGITHILNITRDISDRKRAEKALRESEEQYTRLVNAIPDIIVRSDLEGNILFINDYALEVSGYERNDVIGQSMLMFLHPEDREAMIRNTRLMMEQRLGPREYRLVMKEGRIIPFEVNADVLRTDDGTPYGVVSECRNISERKLAEEMLKTSKIQLTAALDLAGLVYWVLDTEADEFTLNDAFYDMYGTTAEREGGYRLSTTAYKRQFVYPDDLPIFDRSANENIASRELDFINRLEHRIIRRDGAIRHVDVIMRVLKDKSGRLVGVYGANQDITERKRIAEEQKALEAQLQQAQKMEAIGILAGGVAHDFNNILTVILGYAQLGMLKCNPTDTVYKNLKTIEHSAFQSADLVRQLLTFARKQTVAPKVLDLNDTVAGMLKMLQRLIGEDVHFSWEPGSGLWSVKIDPTQVDQLLANLCVNARDAISGVGKITIETENAVIDRSYTDTRMEFIPGEYVMLAVSDSGKGIERDVLEHIFEPFFTTKESGKGTGLGLSTVYGIVKQNQGFIHVYSEPNQGSTFKIYLPRYEGEAKAVTVPEALEMPQGKGETVLLVEDDPTILILGQSILATLNYNVLPAGTPGEAIRLAKAHSREIQLLITDVIMPEMDGKGLSKAIEHIIPGLKCLFASGYTADVIAHHGVLDEGVHFIEKPYSVSSLAVKVHEILYT